MTALHRWMPALALGAAAANGGLLALGVLTPRAALLVFIAVEAPLVLVTIALFARSYRAARAAGGGLDQVLGPIGYGVVRAELRMYRSLWLWARRRVDGAGEGFGYTRGSNSTMVAFAVASAVEAAVVHLLVPWPWLRWTLIVLAGYSLLLLLAFFATRITHPHLLTADELILRSGSQVIARCDRGDLRRVQLTRRFAQTAPVALEGRLFLPGQDGTNIDIDLRAPLTARLPGLWERRRKTVAGLAAISLHLDDPRALQLALAAETSATEPPGADAPAPCDRPA